jgi:O-antigen ligase
MWKHIKFSTIDSKKNICVIAPLYLFIVMNIISLFNLTNIKDAIAYFAITFYMIFYALFIFCNSNMKNYKPVFKAYIAGSTASALFGIAGYLLKIPIFTVYEFSRAKALFKDPNVFGPFLIPTIILLLSGFKANNDSRMQRWIRFIVIIINSIGLLLSFSRGAYVNFFAALIIYLILSYKEIHLKRIMIIGIILIMILNIVWITAIDNDFKDFLSHRIKLQSYDLDRFKAQKSGLHYAASNVFGYGPGQYGLTIERVMDFESAAHSLYIRVMLENGIAGFITMMVFFAAIIFNLLKISINQTGIQKETAAVVLSILCGIMINSIVVDTLHWRHFWFFIGIGISLISEINKETALNRNSIK